MKEYYIIFFILISGYPHYMSMSMLESYSTTVSNLGPVNNLTICIIHYCYKVISHDYLILILFIFI